MAASDGTALVHLFRTLMRLHRAKLPPPMRAVGDRYVRDEFRRHRDATPPLTSQQWTQFASQWQAYARMLDGSADRLPDGTENPAGGLSEDLLRGLNEEQRQRLGALQREAYQVGRTLLDKEDRGPPGQ